MKNVAIILLLSVSLAFAQGDEERKKKVEKLLRDYSKKNNKLSEEPVSRYYGGKVDDASWQAFSKEGGSLYEDLITHPELDAITQLYSVGFGSICHEIERGEIYGPSTPEYAEKYLNGKITWETDGNGTDGFPIQAHAARHFSKEKYKVVNNVKSNEKHNFGKKRFFYIERAEPAEEYDIHISEFETSDTYSLVPVPYDINSLFKPMETNQNQVYPVDKLEQEMRNAASEAGIGSFVLVGATCIGGADKNRPQSGTNKNLADGRANYCYRSVKALVEKLKKSNPELLISESVNVKAATVDTQSKEFEDIAAHLYKNYFEPMKKSEDLEADFSSGAFTVVTNSMGANSNGEFGKESYYCKYKDYKYYNQVCKKGVDSEVSKKMDSIPECAWNNGDVVDKKKCEAALSEYYDPFRASTISFIFASSSVVEKEVEKSWPCYNYAFYTIVVDTGKSNRSNKSNKSHGGSRVKKVKYKPANPCLKKSARSQKKYRRKKQRGR
jgi:hypothetical protein